MEVLSLSVNSISSLRDFTGCTMLRELYLRKNALADLAEIRHLQHLPQLKVLWLTDNPCASHPNYREQVLASLPSLVKLDGQDVAVAVNGPARRSGGCCLCHWRCASLGVARVSCLALAPPAASQVSPVAAGVSGLAPSKSRTVNGTPAEEGVDGATTGSMNVLYAVMALLRCATGAWVMPWISPWVWPI